jgi:hypothetical protein
MKLDTIPKLESFIADALLSSPHIPLGVNVVRLASVQDEEGITAMARSIVIRYTGSSVNIEQKMPVVITRSMTFEIIISAQSYLTESGHDYALQMCAGAYLSLNNHVPTRSGVQILTPFHLTKESFDGLTDSSHYVYTQQWEIEVQEINSMIALDPCVLRGNCSELFPNEHLATIMPGDILHGNEIFVPVRPPTVPGEDFNEDDCGVTEVGVDLYYKKGDGTELFLAEWDLYNLTSTGNFDQSGRFLICTARRKDNNNLEFEFFASNCEGRKVIQIGGYQPGFPIVGGGGASGGSGGGGPSGGSNATNPNWLGGMWNSPQGESGNPTESGGPEPFRATFHQKNGFGYVITPRATIYSDPTNEDSAKATVKYGVLFPVQLGAKLNYDGLDYTYIGGTSLGKAWIKDIDFNMLNPADYLPNINCEEIELDGALDECS